MNSFSDEVLEYLEKNMGLDPGLIALSKSPFQELNVKMLAQQIQGLQVARRKFPFLLQNKQIKYPPKVSLEQASSETLARFKGSLFSGNSFADLTGGFGIDTFWIGKQFNTIHYIEPNEQLLEMVKWNFSELKFSNVKFHLTDAETFLQSFQGKLDCIFLDPSRRIGSNRKIGMQNYQPNVFEIEEKLLAKAEKIMIKVSPMQDISDLIEKLKHVKKIWVCEWEKELKELLILLEKEATADSTIAVEVIQLNKKQHSFSGSFKSQIEIPENGNIEKFVFEPGPALQKSGLLNQFAIENNLIKINPNSQLLFSKNAFKHALGKRFKILANTKFNKKEVLSFLPGKKANVIARNFPMKTTEIKKKLGLTEGGELYLIATSDAANKPRILICERITE